MKHIKIFEDFDDDSDKPIESILGVFTHDDYDDFHTKYPNHYRIGRDSWERIYVQRENLLILIKDEAFGGILGLIVDVDEKNEKFYVAPTAFYDGRPVSLSPFVTSSLRSKISGPSGNDFYQILDSKLPEDEVEKMADRLVTKGDLNTISKIQKSAPRLWKLIQARMGDDKANTAADLGNLGF